jgi:aspartate aminotransferase
MLAERVSRIAPSGTMAVMLAAEALRRTGIDVVDLGPGEPDFPTPPHVAAAAKAAIDAGSTKYTVNAGIPELRAAVCERYRTDVGIEYSPSQILVTAGGKHGLYNALLSLFGPGDEVVTHAPGWPTIVEQIKLADATPIVARAHAEDGFRLRAGDFIDWFGPRTRGVVINSPCNPTGAILSADEMSALAAAAAARGIWVVMDLCYERLVYGEGGHAATRALVEALPERAVLVGSCSKTYAMTGWRCGWVAGPAELVAACNARQSHSTSNICTIAQHAALAALTGSQGCIGDMLGEYRTRCAALAGWLSDEPRLRFATPEGAFYLFVDLGNLLSPTGLRTSLDFARALLDRQHVAITPGEAFDAPGFARLSFATSLARLEQGARRLRAFIADLDREGALEGAGR